MARAKRHYIPGQIWHFGTYDEVKRYHRGWVDDYLGDGKNIRDEKWTKSIAVFNPAGGIENVKSLMGALAIGRKSVGAGESFQLREPAVSYGAHFGVEKSNIEPKNTYLWDNIY